MTSELYLKLDFMILLINRIIYLYSYVLIMKKIIFTKQFHDIAMIFLKFTYKTSNIFVKFI
jgi:hypothetical protein